MAQLQSPPRVAKDSGSQSQRVAWLSHTFSKVQKTMGIVVQPQNEIRVAIDNGSKNQWV